jgi:AraC-like DNA-binding protein
MADQRGDNVFRFSTADYPARERLGAWREIFGRTVVSLNIEPLAPEGFQSEATVCGLAGLGLLVGRTSAVHFSHTADLIRDDDLSFVVGLTERWNASQLGREAVLGTGDGVLMCHAEVGSVTLPIETRFKTFRVPVAAIEPLVPELHARIATPVPAQSTALRLLSSYLDVFGNVELAAAPDVGRAAVAHVYDLLALALDPTRDAAEVAKGRGLRAARLHAIKADIVDDLTRADLSVVTIAAKHHVTPRYVQMLFEDDGITFSEFVLARRLARVRTLLADPRHTGRAIGAIALDAGFGDLSHFNKMFRRRFGATPSDIRAAAQRARNGG